MKNKVKQMWRHMRLLWAASPERWERYARRSAEEQVVLGQEYAPNVSGKIVSCDMYAVKIRYDILNTDRWGSELIFELCLNVDGLKPGTYSKLGDRSIVVTHELDHEVIGGWLK